jgi:hypothetical protein
MGATKGRRVLHPHPRPLDGPCASTLLQKSLGKFHTLYSLDNCKAGKACKAGKHCLISQGFVIH